MIVRRHVDGLGLVVVGDMAVNAIEEGAAPLLRFFGIIVFPGQFGSLAGTQRWWMEGCM